MSRKTSTCSISRGISSRIAFGGMPLRTRFLGDNTASSLKLPFQPAVTTRPQVTNRPPRFCPFVFLPVLDTNLSTNLQCPSGDDIFGGRAGNDSRRYDRERSHCWREYDRYYPGDVALHCFGGFKTTGYNWIDWDVWCGHPFYRHCHVACQGQEPDRFVVPLVGALQHIQNLSIESYWIPIP